MFNRVAGAVLMGLSVLFAAGVFLFALWLEAFPALAGARQFSWRGLAMFPQGLMVMWPLFAAVAVAFFLGRTVYRIGNSPIEPRLGLTQMEDFSAAAMVAVGFLVFLSSGLCTANVLWHGLTTHDYGEYGLGSPISAIGFGGPVILIGAGIGLLGYARIARSKN